MPPVDPTPPGDEMVRRLPEQKFPQPMPDDDKDVADTAAADVSERPGLPEHVESMAADVEDEDADPVTDTGPGIADGVRGLRGLRGQRG